LIFGILIDLLIREKRLTEPKAKEKFHQLVSAVEYIHSKNIVSQNHHSLFYLVSSLGSS
jgi:serine/threonine protein kinase